MKVQSLFLVLVISVKFAFSTGTANEYLKAQTFMTSKTAEKKFGLFPFDKNAFVSDEKKRPGMAATIIKKQMFAGQPAAKVIAELGAPTGHFWNESIPAYLLNTGWKNKEDTWQLVFLLDAKGVVIESKIHKNCCP